MVSISLLMSAILLGGLAVPHCATMCACNFAQRWMHQAASRFLLGRLLAYVALGAVAGLASESLVAIAWAGAPVLMALTWMLHAVLLFSACLLLFTGKTVASSLQQRIQLPAALQIKLNTTPSSGQSLRAGLLWFLMPCGVLYAAVALAFLGGSTLQGAMVMLVFGLVTGLGMQAMRSARQWAGRWWTEQALNRISGGLIVLALLLMALRGFGVLPTPALLQNLGLCI